MTKIRSSIFLLFITGVLLSCKKTENKTTGATGITDSQVAAISAGSLSISHSGMAANFSAIVLNVPFALNQVCGSVDVDSTTNSGNSNGVVFNYFLKYTHVVNCNPKQQQDNLVYDLSYHGQFDSPTLSSIDTGTSTFKIAGFAPQATIYGITGEYKRSGKFTLKGKLPLSGSSMVDVVVTRLIVSKSTGAVTGGTATANITIVIAGATSNYVAPVTFKADGTASIVINGTTYVINLYTGVISNG